jgi:hypothetical protein
MDAWMWLIIALPLIVLVGGAMSTAMKTSDFANLGDISGKSLSEITQVVGQPNSVSSVPDGTLYQWIGVNGGSSYHYAILFGPDGRAIGYTHQHVG